MGYRHTRADCANCGRNLIIRARGLCASCHRAAIREGTVDDWRSGVVDRRSQVIESWAEGLTHSQIARRLGCSVQAVQKSLARVRRSADGSSMPTYSSPARVASLSVKPPPETPPCVGADPTVFDLPIDREGRQRVLHAPGRPTPMLRAQLDYAFGVYCQRCPLAVREWCVRDATMPREFHADIIAGGAVWVNGLRVYDIAAWLSQPWTRDGVA